MNKIQTWFFLVEENGKREVMAYGNSSYYTEAEAEAGMKAVCNSRKGCKFIRAATVEEACR